MHVTNLWFSHQKFDRMDGLLWGMKGTTSLWDSISWWIFFNRIGNMFVNVTTMLWQMMMLPKISWIGRITFVAGLARCVSRASIDSLCCQPERRNVASRYSRWFKGLKAMALTHDTIENDTSAATYVRENGAGNVLPYFCDTRWHSNAGFYSCFHSSQICSFWQHVRFVVCMWFLKFFKLNWFRRLFNFWLKIMTA